MNEPKPKSYQEHFDDVGKQIDIAITRGNLEASGHEKRILDLEAEVKRLAAIIERKPSSLKEKIERAKFRRATDPTTWEKRFMGC